MSDLNEPKQTVICHGVDRKTKEVPVEKLVYRPSVYGVMIQNNQVLLVPEWHGYDFPGGAVEKGETFEKALKREFKEETGLTCEVGELLHLGEDFFYPPENEGEKYYYSILMYFRILSVSGTITTAFNVEEEKGYMKEAVWMPIQNVDEIIFINSVDSPTLIRKAL